MLRMIVVDIKQYFRIYKREADDARDGNYKIIFIKFKLNFFA